MEKFVMPKEPCWKCKKAPGEDVSCVHCAALQPLPRNTDFFSLLNQPYLFDLNLPALQDSFYALSRRYHPDFYQKREAQELKISTDNTALVNAAYQTLSHPEKRIPYLVSLAGGPPSTPAQPPEDIFDAVLKLQETLEAVKNAEANCRDGHLQALCAEREQIMKRYRQEQAELEAQADIWDRLEAKGGGGPPFTPAHRECAEKMRILLSHRAYLERVLNDTAPFFLEPAPEILLKG